MYTKFGILCIYLFFNKQIKCYKILGNKQTWSVNSHIGYLTPGANSIHCWLWSPGCLLWSKIHSGANSYNGYSTPVTDSIVGFLQLGANSICINKNIVKDFFIQ